MDALTQKTYKIANVTLTQQAFLVFVLGLVVSAMSMYAMRKAPMNTFAMMTIVLLAYVSYSTYLTNCTVVGKCERLAWFLVIINVMSALGLSFNSFLKK